MRKPKIRSDGMQQAIAAAGGAPALARTLGLSHQAVFKWTKIPSRQVIPIEALTGVPREILRPDLYPPRPKNLKRA